MTAAAMIDCPGCGTRANPAWGKCFECGAHLPLPADKLADEVARLAKMAPLEYAQRRKAKADKLGVPVGMLDREIKRARGDKAGAKHGQGRPLDLPTPEPWPELVDGAALLDELAAAFERHVALPSYAATALVLWTMLTWCLDHCDCAPRLLLTSPEPECGKTLTFDVLGQVVRRPLLSSSMTGSVVFRVIDRKQPTVLADEFDAVSKDDEALRAILNSGHTRATAFALRNVDVGGDYEPDRFSTWATIAIAMIGKPHPTLLSRSIVISMRRKRPDESVARFDRKAKAALANLAPRCARWAADHAVALADADPAMPDDMRDRAADNWRNLVAIADAAGGDWPKRARAAALALSAESAADGSAGMQLLADVRAIFEEAGADRLASSSLIDRLTAMEDRRWPEWRHGKPMTATQLARILKRYGIAPRQVWIDGRNVRAYLFDDFADAFARYPSRQSARPLEPTESATSRPSASARNSGGLADRKPLEPTETATSSGLADRER